MLSGIPQNVEQELQQDAMLSNMINQQIQGGGGGNNANPNQLRVPGNMGNNLGYGQQPLRQSQQSVVSGNNAQPLQQPPQNPQQHLQPVHQPHVQH